jgi:hypothetical protein
MRNIIGNIKKFIWNTIKYAIFYPFMIIMAISIIIGIWDVVTSKEAREECYATHGELYCDLDGNVGDKEAIDKELAEEARIKAEEARSQAEQKVRLAEQNKARQLIAESKRETAKHTACRLELHRENPYGGTYNGLSNLVWDTSAFGTFADGDVWVGYNRKVGDKVFYNMRKIC